MNYRGIFGILISWISIMKYLETMEVVLGYVRTAMSSTVMCRYMPNGIARKIQMLNL